VILRNKNILENNACQQESGTGNVILGTGVGLKAA
jgi:hypothetical protein